MFGAVVFGGTVLLLVDEWYRSLSWWERLRWKRLDGRRG